MKLDRGRGLYHKKPLRCDLSMKSLGYRQSVNMLIGRGVSVNCLAHRDLPGLSPFERLHELSAGTTFA